MTAALDVRATGAHFDAIKTVDAAGVELWSARALMYPLGYGADWRNFADTIERARAACRNSGHDPQHHFGDATKMVRIGSGAERAVPDVLLTRYAAYLVAMNGDPRKLEVAAAQTYFAVKTREAELSAAPVPAARAISPRELALMVLAEADRADKAEAAATEHAQLLAAVTPKAQAWDDLASGDGNWAVADAAKILSQHPDIEIGRDRLFAYLEGLGWIYRDRSDGRFRAYQQHVNNGRLAELPASHRHPRTQQLVFDPPIIRVTPKGLGELRTRLLAASTTS